MSEKNLRIAIDTGGTFTDCVYLRDGQIHVLKVFSTPSNPSLAVLEALREIGAGEAPVIHHGTTVGTNAMLERKGARVALITTAGFEDVIAIGRQTRSKLYDWFLRAPECLVPSELRFGVPERVSAEGDILRVPSEEELGRLVELVRGSGAESAAVCLLFSFARPENERLVEEALRPLGLPVSVSHRILPEFREYERSSTVVVNAYLAPKMERYLLDLEGNISASYPAGKVSVMQSSGGIISARLAAQEPVRTVLSGPAGGVIGAYQMARQAGFERIIGFDMGGTSTDVSLVDAASGGLRLTNESVLGGVPIAVPMLDIHTVGAGGGSIARFDAGGLLRVGPESAGSDPGPICFGRGVEPTVTDANLLLGRLDVESFLGGTVALDRERTVALMEERKESLGSAEEFASGILRIVETQMEKAIRVISIERGHDPRDFTLVAFGGGGPLHACAIARALHIPRVLIPCSPGALSAVGILLADFVRDYSRTVMKAAATAELEDAFRTLEALGHREFLNEGLIGIAERSVDLRYQGQGYELAVPYGPDSQKSFHSLHRQYYGFCDEERPVEVVNLRVRMISLSGATAKRPMAEATSVGARALPETRPVYFEGEWVEAFVYQRERLVPGDCISGPAMITEYSSVTILPERCNASVDPFTNLVIEVQQ